MQDFEDWDDIGLNVPRPSDLASLYRQYSHATPGFLQSKDVACSVNLDLELNPFSEAAQIDQDSTNELLNRLVSTQRSTIPFYNFCASLD